jgi:hypothetical protein
MVRISRFLLIACLGLFLVACFEGLGSRRRERTATSMVWLSPGSAPLEVSSLVRLQAAGVTEAFISVAELDFTAQGGPLIPRTVNNLPPSMPVTLVIQGKSLPLAVEDAKQRAEEVAAAARQLRFEVESRGPIPVGLHFDLRQVAQMEALVAFLKEFRSKLDQEILLSISLQSGWLEREGIEDLVTEVDFVVPFLYGQHIYEEEDSKAWDFVVMEQRLQRLEELDVPYLLGVITLGTATHLRADGSVRARSTRMSLQEILWNRDLKLKPGFSLEGVNRRVYSVDAAEATRVGRWEVAKGEGIRIVRGATSDLEELLRLLSVWELPNYMGVVYHRLSGVEERLSLSLENLLNALARPAATPELELAVHLQRSTGRGWLVRFSITNRNGEITELSTLDSNYLEVHCLNGTFGRAAPGQFYRYDLYRTKEGGEVERTFRRSNIIRLHVPILGGEQRVDSGDIEIRVQGEPRFVLSGSFLLPDGRTLELEPVSWP